MHESAIAYLGPKGTYSHEAVHKFVCLIQEAKHTSEADVQENTNSLSNLVECNSLDEVFECVDRGRALYGVVPTENSIEGVVTATLDNFAFNSNAIILAETILDIHHCLVVHPEAQLKDIMQIYSHPQGLAQCRRYIATKFPGVKLCASPSTAQSAQHAANNIHVAGIANSLAAKIVGAKVQDTDIEDNLGNQTKFALISRPNCASPFANVECAVNSANTANSTNAGSAQPTYKTSLALFLQSDRVGALLMILEEFAYANVNLSMLQSRPTKQALGDYMFFVDFEGKVTDPHVQTALNCLRLKLREVKVLGCYPVW